MTSNSEVHYLLKTDGWVSDDPDTPITISTDWPKLSHPDDVPYFPEITLISYPSTGNVHRLSSTKGKRESPRRSY